MVPTFPTAVLLTFTNDHLRMSYLKHFDKFTKDSTKGAYRLLIFDGHSSHLN
jgi:hypothetical protein